MPRPTFDFIFRLLIGVVLTILTTAVATTVAMTVATGARAEPRLALVIGETNYALAPMATPGPDAGAVAQALAQAGFDVKGYADLDRDGLRHAFEDLVMAAKRAGSEAMVFVFLAGHGVQFNGDNYIVPIEATLARDVDVPSETVRLGDLGRDLAALPLKARILVYDLANANPFAPLASGLSVVDPPAGSLVAFNTAPGTVALPDKAAHGIYAEALSEMMAVPDLPLETMFVRVRARVTALSNGATIPWHAGTVEPALALFPAARATAPTSMRGSIETSNANEAFWAAVARDTMPAYAEMKKAFPADPLIPRIDAILAARLEALTWTDALRANTANALWTYMKRYPRGPHFADARRALAAIPAALEPPPRFDIVAMPDRPAPQAANAAMLNRPFLSFDDSRFVSVPPPPSSLVPPVRAAYYDRPVAGPAPAGAQPGPAPSGALPVSAASGTLPFSAASGTLPIPVAIPLGFAAKPGRIDLPRLAPPVVAPTATMAKPPTVAEPTIGSRTSLPTTSVGNDVSLPRVPVVPPIAPIRVPEPLSPTVKPIQPVVNPAMPVPPSPVLPVPASPSPVQPSPVLPASVSPPPVPPPPVSPVTANPVPPATKPSPPALTLPVSPSKPQPVAAPPPVPRSAPPTTDVPPPPFVTSRPDAESAPRARADVPLPPRRPVPIPLEPRRLGKQQFPQPKASQRKAAQPKASQRKKALPEKPTRPVH